MSIDRDTFENTSEDELDELSVPDQVLGFLAANEDRAFKAREIASQIGVDEGAVSTALCAAIWGGVYPFTLLPDVAWATLIALTLTVSASVHIYYERNMRLGDLEVPPELDFE